MVIFIIMNTSNINEKSILLKIHKTTTEMLKLLQEIKNNKLEIEKYINFCTDQKKRMEEDMKTRKNYERLVHD